jgi:hypothetical protein
MLLACSTQTLSCVRRRLNRLIIDYTAILSLTAYSVVFDAAPIQLASSFFFTSAYIQFYFSFRNVFDKIIKDSVGYILPHISIFCLVSCCLCERHRRIGGK